MGHGLSCSAACGIFPHQGSNPHLLHWQADSLPLSHQGSPTACFLTAPPHCSQVLDGRRPTGGRLEVMVRIREPLTAQQLETTTERWLVIDPVPASMPTVRPLPISSPGGKGGLGSRWPRLTRLVLSSEAGCWPQREGSSRACSYEGAREQVGDWAQLCWRECPSSYLSLCRTTYHQAQIKACLSPASKPFVAPLLLEHLV